MNPELPGTGMKIKFIYLNVFSLTLFLNYSKPLNFSILSLNFISNSCEQFITCHVFDAEFTTFCHPLPLKTPTKLHTVVDHDIDFLFPCFSLLRRLFPGVLRKIGAVQRNISSVRRYRSCPQFFVRSSLFDLSI